MKKILYLSMTGMAEPLGQSQVLEYLIGLRASYDITLFSFERVHDESQIPNLHKRMEAERIRWFHRPYSNRFGVFSAAWILIAALFQLLYITLKHKPDVIHARSFLPALLGWLLAKISGAKLLYDIRGFAMDEKIDSGRLKSGSALYRFLHVLEKFLYRHCDHLVTLTHTSKTILNQEFHLPENKITVIPTCANKILFYPMNIEERKKLRQKLGFAAKQKIVIRTGSVLDWYDFDSEVALFAELYRQDASFHFIILNKSEHAFIKQTFVRYHLPETSFSLLYFPLNEVVQWLNIADVALFFIKPSYAKQASAPTKFAEIVASELPCVSNTGVGDMDFYIGQYGVGLTFKLEDVKPKAPLFAKAVLDFLAQPIEPSKFHALFNEHFDKNLAIKRYQAIYDSLVKADIK